MTKYIAPARRQAAARTKVTLRLKADDDALLRLAVHRWGWPQGEMVGLALQYFAAAGGITASKVTFDAEGEARVAAALAEAKALVLAELPAHVPAAGSGAGEAAQPA